MMMSEGLFAKLLKLAESFGLDELDVLYWVYSPTTYFEDERRPLDHWLDGDDLVLSVADKAWGIVW